MNALAVPVAMNSLKATTMAAQMRTAPGSSHHTDTKRRPIRTCTRESESRGCTPCSRSSASWANSSWRWASRRSRPLRSALTAGDCSRSGVRSPTGPRSHELRVQRHAAVEHERGSRQVAGLVAGRPHDAGGDLLRAAHAAERDLALDGVLLLGVVEDELVDRGD